MQDPNPHDAKRFTFTVVISFAVLFVFAMLMMLWRGSYEKKANGEIKYNTRVIEATSGY